MLVLRGKRGWFRGWTYETGVFRCDSSIGEDGGSFDDRQRGASVGECREMNEMEVRKMAIVCGIHAHRCNPWCYHLVGSLQIGLGVQQLVELKGR